MFSAAGRRAETADDLPHELKAPVYTLQLGMGIWESSVKCCKAVASSDKLALLTWCVHEGA